MILLVLRVKQMRSTYATDFRHHGRILSRCITEKSPVCAPPTVDDVINRSSAQAKTRLYVPMFHSRLCPKLEGLILYHIFQMFPDDIRRSLIKPDFWGLYGVWASSVANAVTQPQNRPCRGYLATCGDGVARNYDCEKRSSMMAIICAGVTTCAATDSPASHRFKWFASDVV